jgi:hypothetical protein
MVSLQIYWLKKQLYLKKSPTCHKLPTLSYKAVSSTPHHKQE